MLAKAGTAASRNRLNPNFFMMLFADSVCEVRHHTATVGNLWEMSFFCSVWVCERGIMAIVMKKQADSPR